MECCSMHFNSTRRLAPYYWRYGADRDRTDDLRLAKPALSQLSYSPRKHERSVIFFPTQVGLGRLELPTSSLSGMRSNHLSYRPFRSRPLSKLNSRSPLHGMSLRKEVIQPQVPLRLPCYDFTPVTSRTLGSCLPCGLAHSLPVQPTPMV